MGYFNGYGDDTEGAMWGDYSPMSSRHTFVPTFADDTESVDLSSIAIFAEIESQNKELATVNSQPVVETVKRGRGRPAGAKNRYHLVNGIKTLKAEFVK